MKILPLPTNWAEVEAHLEDEHDVSISNSRIEVEDARRMHADLHRGRPTGYTANGHVHEEGA